MSLPLKKEETVTNVAHASHPVSALVLNCMDHRLVAAVTEYLHGRGLQGQYDQISLAGGAIGILSDQSTPWAETFWAQLALARDLHGVRKVIMIDHRDCGACKAFVGKDCAKDRDRELALHLNAMKALSTEIRKRAPEMAVELLFMELDGSVTRLDG